MYSIFDLVLKYFSGTQIDGKWSGGKWHSFQKIEISGGKWTRNFEVVIKWTYNNRQSMRVAPFESWDLQLSNDTKITSIGAI